MLHLIDHDPAVVDGLRAAFREYPEVEVAGGNIVELASGCVVSPANSFGYMDGGIDLVYSRFFGPELEGKIRAAIATRGEGHLPVGASLVVATGHARIPYMIVAPTMVMPEAVEPLHAARAMSAVLRAQRRHAIKIKRVYCPGLTTGVGLVSPAEAAVQMASAYRDWREAPERSQI